MTWGIIGAMPSEIALLETQMSGAKKEVVSGLTYQTGKICGCAAAKSARSMPPCAHKHWRCVTMWIVWSTPELPAAPVTIWEF